MRDQFFKLYVDIYVAQRYYCRYTQRSVIWNNIITSIGLLTSAATISSWAIWGSLSLVWAVLIASSQVFTVLRPMLKSSARLSAAKYLIPEMTRLLDNLADTWDEMNYVRDFPKDELFNVIHHYRHLYTEICEKYASSELFPEKVKLHKAAQEDANIYFSVHYHTSQEAKHNE